MNEESVKATSSNYTALIQQSPRFLWFFTLAYSMVIALANWFDARLIQIYDVNLSPGTLIFPVTFLLADIITEVYGYKHARRAIWAALLFNLFFIIYGQILIHLPSPSFAYNNSAFDRLFKAHVRIIVSSFLSYFVSETLNAYFVAKLKLMMRGQYMGIRFVLSTIIASAFDSVIFTTIAFYKIIPTPQLLYFIINVWLAKTCIEIMGLPISIRLTRFIKKKEEMDIYDTETKFNVFSLNSVYSYKQNKY